MSGLVTVVFKPGSLIKRVSVYDLVQIVLVLLFELYLCAKFASHHTPAQQFVFLTYCIAVFADVLFIRRLLKNEKLDLKSLAVLVVLAASVGVLLEGLTVLGSPASHFANLHDWNKRRLIVFCLAAFLSVQALFICRNSIAEAWRRLRQNSSKLFRTVVVVLVVVLVCLVVAFRIGATCPFFFYATAGLIVLFTIIFFVRNFLSLPIAFFLIAFTCGSTLVYGVPVTTGISWDDQIHYENALNASYLCESQLTDTDRAFSAEAIERAQGKDAPDIGSFDPVAISRHSHDLDASYESDVARGRTIVDKGKESIYTINEIGYIPFAVGLWLGRLLHFGFSSTVLFARLCNLLCYTFVISCAIRVAPSKKFVFAFVGLIPTCVFLAANFSYDTWLISFTMLGFAFYLRYAWGHKSEFTIANVVACFAFTFIGLAVKAVYFPLIGIYLFVPRDRFMSSRQRLAYYMSVVFFGLYMLASFALPFLFAAGGESSDVRGGAGVDSAGQLSFIISNPLRYAEILVGFLFSDFLAPINSARFSLSFGYFSSVNKVFEGACFVSVLSCAPALAFMTLGAVSNDELSVNRASIWASLWAILMCLCSLVLVATALYISFTPVGLDTVNGCQYRYIVPTLVPALSVGMNNRLLVVRRGQLVSVLGFVVAGLSFAVCFFMLVLLRFL